MEISLSGTMTAVSEIRKHSVSLSAMKDRLPELIAWAELQVVKDHETQRVDFSGIHELKPEQATMAAHGLLLELVRHEETPKLAELLAKAS